MNNTQQYTIYSMYVYQEIIEILSVFHRSRWSNAFLRQIRSKYCLEFRY